MTPATSGSNIAMLVVGYLRCTSVNTSSFRNGADANERQGLGSTTVHCQRQFGDP